jgi:hypothetical protein
VNLDQLKRNLYQRVQLDPVACSLDASGNLLDRRDDDWTITAVTDDGVRIENQRTRLSTTLARDHIHHYTSNPDRSTGGLKFGFLTLNVQLFMQGNEMRIRPNSAPGRPVELRSPIARMTLSTTDKALKAAQEQAFREETMRVLRTEPQQFHRAAEALFAAVEGLIAQIAASTGWAVTREARAPHQYVVCFDWVSMQLLARELSLNDASWAHFLLRYFDGRMLTPSEIEQRRMLVDQPQELHRSDVRLCRVPREGWCWSHAGAVYSHQALADLAIARLVEFRESIGTPILFRR